MTDDELRAAQNRAMARDLYSFVDPPLQSGEMLVLVSEIDAIKQRLDAIESRLTQQQKQ